MGKCKWQNGAEQQLPYVLAHVDRTYFASCQGDSS